MAGSLGLGLAKSRFSRNCSKPFFCCFGNNVAAIVAVAVAVAAVVGVAVVVAAVAVIAIAVVALAVAVAVADFQQWLFSTVVFMSNSVAAAVERLSGLSWRGGTL